MALFRAATLLSLCLLLAPLHAVPYSAKAAASRFGDRHHDPHEWKRAVMNHVSERTFTSRPMVSHLTRLLKNAPRHNDIKRALPKIANRQGFVGDQCSTDADCQGPRQCIAAEEGGIAPCTTASFFCFCFSPAVTCSSEDDCDPGELCTAIPQGTGNLCVSADALANVNIAVEETAPGLVSVGMDDSPLIDGLNGDSCSFDSDCTGSRECFGLSGTDSVPCSGQEDCVCLTQDPICSSNSDCESGEFCQSVDEEASIGICLSTFLVPSNPAAQAANEEAIISSIEDEEPIPSDDVDTMFTLADVTGPSEEKLNFDVCQSSDECAGTRRCENQISADVDCSATTECRCIPSDNATCTSDDECDDGESCIGFGSLKVCFSDNAPLPGEEGSGMETEEPLLTVEPEFTTEEPIPTDDILGLSESEISVEIEASPSPTAEECQDDRDCPDGQFCEEIDGRQVCEPVSNGDEEVSVCISTHHLSHMNQEELLYSTHRVARVLCDENNSCATPGHMIKYKNTAMMMSSYCEKVGCTSKIDTVNSPRYYPGKLVKSHSDGLEFTAHAARYSTRVEERMLSIAVRVGL
ncbi:hypothetical protein FGB62_178g027 [Gracilaria domingensis]|nr:hypothetical protein FGB62_178g027 [Gracilaria domingensis]